MIKTNKPTQNEMYENAIEITILWKDKHRQTHNVIKSLYKMHFYSVEVSSICWLPKMWLSHHTIDKLYRVIRN